MEIGPINYNQSIPQIDDVIMIGVLLSRDGAIDAFTKPWHTNA